MRIKYDFPLEDILAEYTSGQLQVLFANLDTIELADACSLNCKWCGAPSERPKSKDYASMISFRQMKMLVENFGEFMKSTAPFLYFSSDPLDWEDGNLTYRELSMLFEDELGYKPGLFTSVPAGKEELMHQLLLEDKVDRISLSPINFHRLKKFFIEKYPELVDPQKSFVVEKENGKKKVKFNNSPRDAKYGDIYWVLLMWKLQRETSPGYTDAFTLADEHGKFDEEKAGILGPENIRRLSVEGVVKSFGAILRSSGFHNLYSVKPSEEHPFGYYTESISSHEFNPLSLWRMPRRYVMSVLDYVIFKEKDVWGTHVAFIPTKSEDPDFRAMNRHDYQRPDFIAPVYASEVKIGSSEKRVVQDLLKLCIFLSQPCTASPELKESKRIFEHTLAAHSFYSGDGIINNPSYKGDAYIERLRSAVAGLIDAGKIESDASKGFLEAAFDLND